MATLVAIGLIPVISTVISMAAAYTLGGYLRLGLYILMSIAASALFSAPAMAINVIFIAFAAMANWLIRRRVDECVS